MTVEVAFLLLNCETSDCLGHQALQNLHASAKKNIKKMTREIGCSGSSSGRANRSVQPHLGARGRQARPFFCAGTPLDLARTRCCWRGIWRLLLPSPSLPSRGVPLFSVSGSLSPPRSPFGLRRITGSLPRARMFWMTPAFCQLDGCPAHSPHPAPRPESRERLQKQDKTMHHLHTVSRDLTH